MSRVRRFSHFLHATAPILILCALGSASVLIAEEMPHAGAVSNVSCVNDPSESYAEYLPSGYSSAKKWPIIYLFDPGGRGRRPVEMYKDLAEKYGVILAGSNTSHNFSNDQAKHIKAIWDDTHARLTLDERRIYASGFSGGARLAGAMALSCSTCQVAGVIAHGAGYPSAQPIVNRKVLYFFAVGNQDFNWPEVMTIRREREDQGLPYRVRVFDGTHQWAPPEVMEDAITWLMLRSIQEGDMPRDAAFIDHMYQLRQAQAAEAENGNDALAQLAAYRSLVSDFSGLRDTSEFSKKLTALKQSVALNRALKSEHEEIDEQLSMERAIAPKLQAYVAGSEPDPTALRAEILQALGGLNDQAQRAKKASKRQVSSRAFTDLWVSGMENGQQELEAGHLDKAEIAFDLMSQVKNDAWPVLLLAETHALAGNKKEAIRVLREAVRRGLKDATVIESETRLQSLKGEPEFQKLLADLQQK